MLGRLLEPVRAYWARKRWERMQYETATRLLKESVPGAGPEWVEEDPDFDDWRLAIQLGDRRGTGVSPVGRGELGDDERADLLAKARHLAETNPYARNALNLLRDYVVGTGMRHEVCSGQLPVVGGQCSEPGGQASRPPTGEDAGPPVALAARLWREFLDANDWECGHRKDWEFCERTWRDGECFLRIFRPANWPPRVHFIDPEDIAPDPVTGLPTGGIETEPGNVEVPRAYRVADGSTAHAIPADRILHAKIGVDANVKRGLSLFLPVLQSLRRYQGWLDTELTYRKLASSIVFVRKHTQNTPSGVNDFADSAASSCGTGISPPGCGSGVSPVPPTRGRTAKIMPGSIVDVQGFDLQLLSPNAHFADASQLGRMILLSIAAGTGLPEFMLSADASNANYASTLVAEGPAVRHFAAWQAFFIGQWRKLFRMVMADAHALGLLTRAEAASLDLRISPPPLAVRNRHHEAQADAIYFDRGALSAQELARRDGADPERMQRERGKG